MSTWQMGQLPLGHLKKDANVGIELQKKVAKIGKYIAILATIGILLINSSCSLVDASAGPSVKIDGTWDLISPLERQIVPVFNGQSDINIQVNYSSSGIDLVKKGKIDLAITGIEPTSQELPGLKENVIAYDAVCIIVDANSYAGGEYLAGSAPVRKADGFQNLSMDDLKGLFSYPITPIAYKWAWSGNYFSWLPVFDLNKGTDTGVSDWMRKIPNISPQLRFIPGKYDTQTLLYKVLGLDESAIAKTWNKQYSDSMLDAEEEYLAAEYPPGRGYEVGTGDFTYKIGIASRRVIPIALQHVPIKVVSINGIDPLQNTQAIYDGSYPLSRKIYLISSENCSKATSAFINFLLSTKGQQTLSQIGYLPVQPN